MPPLTADGPAGLPHDPFAGTAPDEGTELTFPADRYATAGVPENVVDELQAYFDGLDRREQRSAIAWHAAQTDDQLREGADRFVEARDALLALGGLTDEQRDDLAALSDEDRDALADLSPDERTALAEYAAALDELAGLSEEDRAAVAELAGGSTETPPDGATSAAPAPSGAPATSDTPEAQSGSQTGGDGPTFTTKQIADLKIDEVLAAIARGEVTAEQALEAEQGRGDDVRPRLIEKLTPLIGS